jgi:hypothetical protein
MPGMHVCRDRESRSVGCGTMQWPVWLHSSTGSRLSNASASWAWHAHLGFLTTINVKRSFIYQNEEKDICLYS